MWTPPLAAIQTWMPRTAQGMGLVLGAMLQFREVVCSENWVGGSRGTAFPAWSQTTTCCSHCPAAFSTIGQSYHIL